MSLLWLKCYCLHDEVQTPLHRKQILSWNFPENLREVTGTLFHQALISCTTMELLLLTSSVIPHARARSALSSHDSESFYTVDDLPVDFFSTLIPRNHTWFAPSSIDAPYHSPRIQSLNLFFTLSILILITSPLGNKALNPMSTIRSLKMWSSSPNFNPELQVQIFNYLTQSLFGCLIGISNLIWPKTIDLTTYSQTCSSYSCPLFIIWQSCHSSFSRVIFLLFPSSLT